jgi:hypothetical protein
MKTEFSIADCIDQFNVSPKTPISIELLREFWRNPFFPKTCTRMDIDYKKLLKILSDRMK